MMIKHKIKNNMSSSGLTRRSRNKDLRADWMPDQVGHDRKEEQGRSMVEMLGVLAIIGVLSIGGIAGYTYGMDKNHANEIIGTVSMMAVTASQGLMLNGDFSLSEFGEKVAGYPFYSNLDYSGTETDFSIGVEEIPTGVCEHIKKSEFTAPFLTLINGKQAGDCQSGLNTVEFVFLDALDKGDEKDRKTCATDNDCAPFLGSGYKCNKTKGICEIQCASNRTYVNGYGCCPNDRLWNGGCCSADYGVKMQEVEGVRMCCKDGDCCPEGQIYDAKTQKCQLCENVTGVINNNTFYYCAMCPNLVKVSKWQCAPACTDPDAVLVNGVCKCPLDRPLLPSNNPTNPQCLPCDYNGQTGHEPPYTASTDTSFTGYYCNRRNGGGYSRYCAPGTVGVSSQQTIILKDGTMYKETDNYGSCKPCDEVDVSALKYQASCESCDGTWVGASWDNGTCQP